MRVGAHGKAHTALQEALSLDPNHSTAAAALLCLSLAQGLQVQEVSTPHEGHPVTAVDPAALECAEVLGHSLKDRQAAAGGVVPWALLALLYRSQGA